MYELGAEGHAAIEATARRTRPEDQGQRIIRQSELGAGALWLRSEPGEDPAQSAALARIITEGIAA